MLMDFFSHFVFPLSVAFLGVFLIVWLVKKG